MQLADCLECNLRLTDCHITVLGGFRALPHLVFIKTLKSRYQDTHILKVKKLRDEGVYAASKWVKKIVARAPRLYSPCYAASQP